MSRREYLNNTRVPGATLSKIKLVSIQEYDCRWTLTRDHGISPHIRWISLWRNTSASSSSSTQPQRCARVKSLSRFSSTSCAVSPISPVVDMLTTAPWTFNAHLPQVTGSSGLPVASAIVSAVEVLPVPGGPCSNITKPFPLPFTISGIASREGGWPAASTGRGPRVCLFKSAIPVSRSC